MKAFFILNLVSSLLLIPCVSHAQEIVDDFSTYAVITTEDETVLSSEMSGRLKAIPFEEGMVFSQGDVLASFSCESVEAEKSAIHAMLRAASAQLKNAQRLDKVGAAGALDLELAKSSLEEAEARRQIIESKLAKCSILAPFDGILLSMNAVEHESIKDMTPILRIGRPGAFRVKVIAPASWLGWIKIGTDFSFQPHGVDRQYEGKIDKIGASVDPASQTIKIEGEIVASPDGLRSGIGGRITAHKSEGTHVQ